MDENYPLLFFPAAQHLTPPKGRPRVIGQPCVPNKSAQRTRLTPQLQKVEEAFNQITTLVADSILGLEPESILVMEIAGTIQDFKQALEAVGLEWLNEWEGDGFSSDEEFYNVDSKGQPAASLVKNRLFVSLANQASMQQLLSLWRAWQKGEGFVRGTNKWKQLFDQLVTIRPWGIEETLEDTDMLDRWQDLLDPINPIQTVSFQIDLFYRRQRNQREKIEQQLGAVLTELSGKLTKTLDIKEIRFHALKAELPAAAIKDLLGQLDHSELDQQISLFNFPGIMHFRPTGQSITSFAVEESGDSDVAEQAATQPSVAALLDGLPLAKHQALNGNLAIDDMFGVEQHYQQGERIHGTSMASLIMRGDLSADEAPLTKALYCIPVLQPDTNRRSRNTVVEHVPEDEFLEDRILLAVQRLFDSTDNTIKVINLSIGNPEQIFTHTPSPLARLIDWLSFKYRVLFLVSAGNYTDSLELGISYGEWRKLTADEKTSAALTAANNNQLQRRLISPAEAFNVLTVGGMHQDEAGAYPVAKRIDLLSNLMLPSLISRLGHGFKRSVKPEIYFPAGRQLFNEPYIDSHSNISLNSSLGSPGHKVAWAGSAQGDLQKIVFTRGTSNATALATRAAIRVYEELEQLIAQGEAQISEELMAVTIKALMVHGARQPPEAIKSFKEVLEGQQSPQKLKEALARYMGYGQVDLNWLLRNTQQRATVIGSGEITQNQIHEYRFPLPHALAGEKHWRKLVITLAWFSSINTNHANLREAKLELVSPTKPWNTTPLKVERVESDHNQVKRGTVQHEILESAKEISAYQEGEELVLHVTCKPDATQVLDELIPYAIAVTLEVKEDVKIPIYQQIRTKIQQQVQIASHVKVRS